MVTRINCRGSSLDGNRSFEKKYIQGSYPPISDTSTATAAQTLLKTRPKFAFFEWQACKSH